jgi:23S rRNA (uracil1939-C5)-methyltransferase
LLLFLLQEQISALDMARNDLHTVLIEKLVTGGLGLGRLDNGIVVLVPYVLPGEKVRVREVDRKKDYITAIPEEVLSTSADRVVPPCPVYGRCGGCDLQHAGPGAQIRLKKAILADGLQRTAGSIFAKEPFPLEDPLEAPDQFGYRQRLRLQVQGEGNYGFFRPESHILEPISRCLLARDELNRVLQQVHASTPFNELAGHCSAFELLFNPAEETTMMLLHFRRKPRPTDCMLAAALTESIAGLSFILLQVEGYGLYDPLERTFSANVPLLTQTLALDGIRSPLSLSWEAGGFCQVNIIQNVNLVRLVLEMAANGPHARVLDLFCGYGNFSLPVAALGSEVLGIDTQNSAIRSAQRNAEQNEIPACRFEKKQVAAAVNSLLAAGRTFETIILDPPRQGAPDAVAGLSKLGAEQIIYISCNPATLARDLALLIPAGYKLSRLVPVDMFPQTHHLESVALLKRAI